MQPGAMLREETQDRARKQFSALISIGLLAASVPIQSGTQLHPQQARVLYANFPPQLHPVHAEIWCQALSQAMVLVSSIAQKTEIFPYSPPTG